MVLRDLPRYVSGTYPYGTGGDKGMGDEVTRACEIGSNVLLRERLAGGGEEESNIYYLACAFFVST